MHIDLQVANHLAIYSKEIEMLKKFKHLINLIKSIEERFNRLDLAIGKIETRLNAKTIEPLTFTNISALLLPVLFRVHGKMSM